MNISAYFFAYLFVVGSIMGLGSLMTSSRREMTIRNTVGTMIYAGGAAAMIGFYFTDPANPNDPRIIAYAIGSALSGNLVVKSIISVIQKGLGPNGAHS